MQIALVYNARPTDIKRTDPRLEKYIEGDEWKTIEAIGHAIERNGHSVTYFPINTTIYSRLEKAKDSIDLLFNLSEGIHGADREAQIPMLAEILGIPYTGPTPLSAALILDKTRAKEIWRAHKVRTAAWQIFRSPVEKLDPQLRFPLIVKPNNEGSGIGIKKNSIVHNQQSLRQAISHILTTYHEPALVEKYLPGREFTVGLVGNGNNLTTLPIIEINFAAFPAGAPQIDSYEAKFIYGATGEVPMDATESCPAKLTKTLEKQILDLATRAYQTIGCLDFGRVDIRLGKDGKPSVMEINHPPGLMSDPEESSFFTIAARAKCWDFDTLIGKILHSAIKRLM